jgi:hypothetical protein
MKENVFMKNALEKGLVDDRQIAVVADISCTNGNRGRAYVFVNGDTLHLYELRRLVDLGEHVESIDLKKAKIIKSSSFVLHTYLKLEYNGYTYHFQGFAMAKIFLDAVKANCGC